MVQSGRTTEGSLQNHARRMPDEDQPISALGWATLVFFFGYWAIFLLGNVIAVLANRERERADRCADRRAAASGNDDGSVAKPKTQ